MLHKKTIFVILESYKTHQLRGQDGEFFDVKPLST
jgi:AMMECR1 domain-containing protein